jgi:hypothetical protein
MTQFTFSAGFSNDLSGWTAALEKTLAVASYKRTFEVTSKYSPVVVLNNPVFSKTNDRNQCHENCRRAELDGMGKRVF